MTRPMTMEQAIALVLNYVHYNLQVKANTMSNPVDLYNSAYGNFKFVFVADGFQAVLIQYVMTMEQAIQLALDI